MKPSRKLLSSVIFFSMCSPLVQAASDITISGDVNSDISITTPFTDATNNGGTSNLNTFTLTSALGGADVVVNTTSAGGSPFGGRIEVKDSIAWSSAKNLTLTADADIRVAATLINTVGGSANLNANGPVTFSADVLLSNSASHLSVTSGAISQTPSSKLTVGGLGTFNAGNSDITLLSDNKFGSLDLTGGAVAVKEADSTLLAGVHAASLALTTAGAITDVTGATIDVTGLATFNAGSNVITLGDNTGGPTNFGSLNLTGTVVNVIEDSGTELAGVKASTLNLTSNGAITDTGNISVNGLATLNAGTNDITLGDDSGTTTDFGSLNITGGAVTISEDSASVLTGVSASSLALTSNGSITDAAGTSLVVTGLATFNAGSNDVTLGDSMGDNTRFGGLNVTGSTVNVIEDDSTLLAGMSASTLNLNSAGAITNTTGATIGVTGLATLSGTSIAIGNMAGDSVNFGTLNFNSDGSVVIEENSSTVFTGSNKGSSLVLSSAGALSHDAGSSLTVTGNASFTGTSITLGNTAGDTMNFGSLTFNSTGAVVIQEDSSTVLTGTSTGSSLVLNSAAGISDTGPSSLTVTGPVAITAGGANSVILDDTAFNVSGNTVLTAGGGQDIIVNNTSNSFGGTVTFASTGTLANVNVFDTTDFDLQALTVTNSLTAISGGALTDSGNLSVAGLATLGGATINIGGGSETTNFGSLNFNSTGSVTIQEDSSTLLTGTSTANSLSLISSGPITDNTGTSLTVTNDASMTATGAITLNNSASDVLDIGGNASFNGSSITIGAAGTANFGSLTFNSGGAVTVQEDSDTLLAGTSTANTLALTSSGSITDAVGTSLTVTNNSSMTAAGAITLNDNASDVLGIGGNASFNGSSINVGSAGTANFGSLTFNSTGSVAIQEDSDTLLTGTSTANTLSLTSSGSITDAVGTSLTVTSDSTMTAAGAITLNDNATDVLSIGGNAAFNGSSITIGSAGTANFGSLTFNSGGAVTVQEDSDTLLAGTSTANTLALTSSGSITDATGTSLTVTSNSTMTAAGAITLNDNATDVLSIGGNASFNGSSITIGAAGTASFGSLTFNSGGAVTIQEDSDTLLTGTSTANTLSLTSSGSITDATGTNLTVTNNSSLTAAGAITLNDNATDVLSIGGNASFNGSSITIGSAGTANFGSLTFNSGGAVTVQEDSDTVLAGTGTANTLALTSSGSITDAVGTSLTVTNNSSMTAAGAITLNDNATDVLSIGGNAAFSGTSITIGSAGTANFGSLTFNSGGAVTVQEDSDTLLTGTSTANTLSLTSSGSITDATGTSLTVTNDSSMTAVGAITLNDNASDVLSIGGNAAFNGSSITIGAAGTANFGSLTFNSGGAVTVQEDSDTVLAGTSTANTLALTSSGSITDATGTSQSVTSDSSMIAAGAITLNDNATDVLSIGGNASFNGSSITIGSAGTANFGSLTFNSGGAVTVQEDSDTVLAGTSTANTLALTSSGSITDATGTSLSVTSDSSMTAAGAITLNDNASDVLSIGGNASFSGTSITIGSAGTANFGSLTFNSTGSVTIQEDSDTLLTGTNTANTLSLTSSGSITDATGTSLTVTNDASMTATGAITLNDNATDVLSIGGNASFNGSTITIGSTGTANFGSLTFNSGGAVTVQEDSDTVLAGTSTANTLALTSSGSITDATGTSLSVTSDSSMIAAGAITLNDNASDVLTVGGNAAFNGSSITIGSAGTANFGSLTFNSGGAVTIQEDSDTLLTGTSTANTLSLASSGSITDNAGTNLTVTNDSSMTAAGAITLNDDATDVMSIGGNASFNGSSITIGAAGTVNFGSLTFNSGGAVTVQEDSDTLLTGTSTANSLALTSSGSITDAIGTSLTVTNDSSMIAAGAITLNNSASDVLDIGGNASFSGSSITIGSAGTANFGSLTFNSAGVVTVQEDSDTVLAGTSTANTLSLTSSGSITDATGTSLTVTSDSSMTAADAITLNDNASDVLTIGGNASFNGSSITIGAAGTANFGSLTFNSGGAVTMQEDSDTLLTGTSTADTLSLTSSGSITDATGTSLTVTNDSSMTAAGAITLNDNVSDVLSIGGNAAFNGSSITIGAAGTANFGSLSFDSSGAVTVQEDSDTVLAGTSTANTLALTSSGSITNTAGTSLMVTSDSTMTAAEAITLNDNATDVLEIGGNAVFNGTSITIGSAGTANFGSLTFNSDGVVTVQEDSDTELAGTSTANALSLTSSGSITDNAGTNLMVTSDSTMTAAGAITLNDDATDVMSIGGNASFNGSSITIGSAGTANFGSLTFNSGGAVGIEEDSDTLLTGTSTADTLSLTSSGSITESTGTSLTVTNNSSLTAAGAITLNDNATDILTIGGNASFSGSSINIGAAGTANFGSLTFNSGGAVTIQEDSNTVLAGTSTANTLALNSSGSITDATGTNLTVTSDSLMTTAGAITLNNEATDVLNIDGNASFNGSSITIGSAGTANFGSLTFNSGGAVTVQEDSDTLLTGTNTATSLTLASAGALTDGANLTVTGLASFSGTSIAIGGAGQTTRFGSLNVNSSGNVDIQEDSNTAFVGSNTANILTLTSSGTSTFQSGSTLDADTLDIKIGMTVLTGNNLTDTTGVKLSGGTTLSLNGSDTIGTLVSNGGTVAGNATLIAKNGAQLNGGAVTGHLLGDTISSGSVLVSGSVGGGSLSVTGGTLSLKGISTNAGVGISAGARLLDINGGLAASARVINSGQLTLESVERVLTYTQNGNGILQGKTLTTTGGATLDGGIVTSQLLGNTTSTGNVRVSGSVGGGFLHVNGGTLTLTGKADTDTLVNAGGTLKGTGLVNGDLKNYGTLAVGSMGKKLTIAGDLVTRGTIALSLKNSRKYEQIQAATVDLGGKLVITNTGSGLARGKRAFIFDAASFSNGVALKDFTTIGFKNGVLFNNHTGTLIGLGGGKSRVTGSYLNLKGNQTNTYLALLDDSVQTGTQNVSKAKNLSGDGEDIRITSGISDGDDRLVAALNQATFATPGAVDSVVINSLSPEVHRGMADFTEQSLRAHVREAENAAPVSHKGKTEVFATLHTTSDGVDSTITNSSYDVDINAATAGMRYDVNGSLMVGGLFGLDDGDIKGSMIDTDAQGFVLGAFSTYQFNDPCKTMLTGTATFGCYDYDATRHSFRGDVHSDGIGSDAVELSLGVSTVLYENHGLRISPTGALRYIGGNVDSFVEKGAGVPLAVDSQDIDTVLFDVGIDLSYQLMERLTLAGRVGYVDSLSDSDESMSATFAASGPAAVPFTVNAPGIDSQAVTLGVGLYYDITDNTRVGATYYGEFRPDSQTSQTFGIGASFAF